MTASVLMGLTRHLVRLLPGQAALGRRQPDALAEEETVMHSPCL
jgi:hypothetical protein